MIDDALARLVRRFNEKSDTIPSVRAEVEGLSRTIAVRFTDAERYAVDLRAGHLTNLRVSASDRADLTITTDTETFERLVAKELGPMKALATRKLSLEGSLEDKLRLRKIL